MVGYKPTIPHYKNKTLQRVKILCEWGLRPPHDRVILGVSGKARRLVMVTPQKK